MKKPFHPGKVTIKLYHGYGYSHNLVLYGHVLAGSSKDRSHFSRNILTNVFQLIRLFMVRPLGKVRLQLHWNGQVVENISEDDGFFRFGWDSDFHVAAGWHDVTVFRIDETGKKQEKGEGNIFVPHVTQFAFISDIDDTVLVSHSATIWRRLRELVAKNPHTRKIFDDAARHYQMLANAHTNDEIPNPFFYISSSEWNLYDDLVHFFSHHRLPDGVFLLNQLKRWYQLIATGKTKHKGKLMRIARVLDDFPRQQFVLLGDNSQQDPSIYTAIAKKYPDKIFAIYIRNVRESRLEETLTELATLSGSNVHVCVFETSEEAIAHAKKIKLL